MIHNYKTFEYVNSMSDDELLEMANVTENETGIDNVVIWIGPSPENHGYRIKVSNIPKKIGKDSLFTITIPDLNIFGNIDTRFINSERLDKIFEFIKKNEQLIMDYSDYKISTKELLLGLKKL